MLFVIPISLHSVSSTSAWSLQPRLPLILTSPTSSLALVTTRSSIASPWAGVLITWLKKLPSMHFCRLHISRLILKIIKNGPLNSLHFSQSCSDAEMNSAASWNAEILYSCSCIPCSRSFTSPVLAAAPAHHHQVTVTAGTDLITKKIRQEKKQYLSLQRNFIAVHLQLAIFLPTTNKM